MKVMATKIPPRKAAGGDIFEDSDDPETVRATAAAAAPSGTSRASRAPRSTPSPSSPSMPPAAKRRGSPVKSPSLLPFIGIGRVSDSAVLATYFIGSQAPPTAEIFSRLLTAARVKMKPGQRIRLENKSESIFVFVSPKSDIVTAVVTANNDYPEEHAYQLLTDLVFQAHRVGNLEAVGVNGLAKALQPVMQELVALYSDRSMAEPSSETRCSSSRAGSTIGELVIGQKVEVEYDGAWYSARLERVNLDGSFRVLYHEDNSFEDVERQFIRVLSPKPQPGDDKELLFCGVGRIKGTLVLASRCATGDTEAKADSMDLFKRLLAASGSKLKAGQKVALANAGGGTVFCMVSADSFLMSCVMTATCDYPEADAYALLDDISSAAHQHLASMAKESGTGLDGVAEKGLQAQMSPRMSKLFKKYNKTIVPSGEAAAGATSARQRPTTSSAGAVEEAVAPARQAEEQRIAEETEALRKAVEERDVERLKAAIARAEANEVSQEGIEKAKAVLADEAATLKTLEQLERAIKSRDARVLEAAITKAEKSMEPRQQKSRRNSVSTVSTVARRSKLASALEEARQVLEIELHRLQVLEDLRRAMNVKEVEPLRKAIAAAESLNPAPSEDLRKARQILEEQTNLMELLRRAVTDRGAFDDFVRVDMEDIEAMMAAKKKFRDAMPLLVQLGAGQKLLDELERLRKKVHNTIQDMKGSIRVFCRIRPLNKKELSEGDADIVQRVDSMTIRVRPNPSQSYYQDFTFDSVFLPDSTQDDVFADTKDLVQSAFDGYNVALFAYGQTGSGKTFTMTGVPGNEGISPRTIQELFAAIERRSARFDTAVSASMLELYRADLVDLLSKGVPVADKQKLKIRMDKSGVVQVEGATVEACRSTEELQDLLDRGSKARAVAATMMNAESSRSHLILSINLESTNKQTGDALRGKIMLVDLAGSERLKKSGTTGNELKESIEINRSLTALGDVIEGLTKNAAVVPYRNHKLTELMQDVIGGSAKTLMFVNCSPASSNLDETLQTLKYATRAKKITNKVKKMEA